MGEFLDNLKERATFAVLALVVGVQAGSLLKDPRPDPFTGTMGRQLEIEMQAYVDFRLAALQEDIEAHMQESKEGYTRIRALEIFSARHADQVVDLRSRLAVLEDRNR
jgi:hypothetical protein